MKVSISDLLLLTASMAVGFAISSADDRLSNTAILTAIWSLVIAKSWLVDRNSLFFFGTATICATAIVHPTHSEMLRHDNWMFPFAVFDFAAFVYIACCIVPLIRDVQRSSQWYIRHLVAALLMLTFTLLSFSERLPPELLLVPNGIIALWLIQLDCNRAMRCTQVAGRSLS
jgi:hypothetical protein